MSHRRVVLTALLVTSFATALKVAPSATRRAALGFGFSAAASFASPQTASARVTEYANQMLNIDVERKQKEVVEVPLNAAEKKLRERRSELRRLGRGSGRRPHLHSRVCHGGLQDGAAVLLVAEGTGVAPEHRAEPRAPRVALDERNVAHDA